MKTQVFQNFKHSKFGVITISLCIGCIGFVLHSCGPVPVDIPTLEGPTLKVNMAAEYKNGIPAGGLLSNINVEISDADGKVSENIKIIYEVKTGGGSVDKTSEITSIGTDISWSLGYQFGQQTMEISAYKSYTSTEHVSGSPFTVLVNTATVKDVEGNIYNLTKAGSKTWMAASLYTTKFRDGTPLLSDLDSAGWYGATEGAYFHANNDLANDQTYGLLYNAEAIKSAKGICPESYHVATSAEWQALVALAGGENEAGNTLRSQDNWGTASIISTDSLLIAIQPAGLYSQGGFGNFGTQALLWSANPVFNVTPTPFFTDGGVMFYISPGQDSGWGCRCVKD